MVYVIKKLKIKAIKKKKKDVDPAEAMNSFMKRLAGAESKPVS